MYEAQCAVVGTVITNPVKRSTPTGDEVLSFRMASNARRQDRNTGEWTDGGTLYLTVTCWRRLVRGVASALMKGDPIIAYGQLRTNEYTNRDGVDRADLEMRASTVGPDLSRCNVSILRARSSVTDAQSDAETEAAGTSEHEQYPDAGTDRSTSDVTESVPA